MVIAFCGLGKQVKETILRENPEVSEAVWYMTRFLKSGEENHRCVSSLEFSALEYLGKFGLTCEKFGYRYAVRKDDLLAKDGIVLTELCVDMIEEAKAINPGIVLVGVTTRDASFLRGHLYDAKAEESVLKEIVLVEKNRNLFDAIISIARENVLAAS